MHTELIKKIEKIYRSSTGKSLKISLFTNTIRENSTIEDPSLDQIMNNKDPNIYHLQIGDLNLKCTSESTINENDIEFLESLADLFITASWQYSKEILTDHFLQGIESSNPLFLVINASEEIVKTGKKWLKSEKKQIEGLQFNEIFRSDIGVNGLVQTLESYSLNKKILFFQTIDKTRRYKASVIKKDNLFVLLVQPLVNINHKLSDFSLDISDFLPHEYIAEFIFLQNSSTRSLEEAKKLTEKLRSRNKEIESISRFPNENPHPIFRFSLKGKTLFINESALEHFGHLSNECDDHFLDIINSLLKSRKKRAEGTIEMNGMSFLYTANFVVEEEYINFYLFDITAFHTEIESLNRSIKEQRDFYEQILNEIPSDIAVFDKDHKYLFVNPQGIKNDEIRQFMIGKDDFDYCNFKGISNEMAVQRRMLFNSILENRSGIEWDDHHIDKEGNSHYVFRRMTPVLGEDNEVKLVIGYGVDITSRVETEQKLLVANQENTLLRTFIDRVKDSIQVVDENGRIIYLNDEAIRRLGFDSNQYNDRYIGEFEPLFVEKEKWNEHYNELKEKRSLSMQSQNINIKSGETIDVDLNLNWEQINDTGYIIAVSRDISEKKKIDFELEQKRKFQEILIETARRYINIQSSEIDAVIDESLSFIGEFTEVDRVYIFNYDHIEKVSSNTFEWCAKDIASEKENLQNIPFEYIPDWTETHFNGNEMYIENVELLPVGTLREILEPQGIKSLLAIPMFSREVCIGFVGFDAVKQLKIYTDEERNLLRLFAEMLVNMFERSRYIREIEQTKAEIASNNEQLEIIVEQEVKKNLDLSTQLTNQDKLVTIGEIAAGIAHDLNTPLGSVNVGIESVDYSISRIFENFIVQLNYEEVIEIYKYSKSRTLGLFQNSSNNRKQAEKLSKILTKRYGLVSELSFSLSRLFVQCQISEDEEDIISKFIGFSNPSAGLELLYAFLNLSNLLESSKTSVARATDVVRNLKSFVKESNNAPFTAVNINDSLKTVMSVFNHELRKTVELSYYVDESLEIMADEIKLFQLWSNLIKNALEAMDGQHLKRLSISTENMNSEIKVLFSNNGPMIPQQIREQIFEKFFSTKHHKSGTGLGLSIVNSIVSDHNADLQLESNPEQTTFSIIFKKPISNGKN